MRVNVTTTSTTARRLAGVALSAAMIWLTGLSCLVACAAVPAGESECCVASGCVTPGEGPVPAAHGPGAAASVPSGACPFLVDVGRGAVPAGREMPAAVPAETSAPPLATAAPPDAQSATAAPWVANRGDTYLRCRVLLI